MLKKFVALCCAIVACTAWSAPAAPFHLKEEIPIAGSVRWDYAFVDQVHHKLYVAHGDQTEVLDTRTDKLLGTLQDSRGVHGVAVADRYERIFTSNGADNAVAVYDANTLAQVQLIKAGRNPDAIVYDPDSRRVLAFNGGSQDLTLIDAETGAVVLPAVPLGGKPEFAAVGKHGLVYFNIEDKAQIGVFDANRGTVVKRYSIAPCESPTGLAIDPQQHLYSVCRNGLMVVSDPARGDVLAKARIGHGPDGVAWVTGMAISANGKDGTITVVNTHGTRHWEVTHTIATAIGARTIAADRDLHKLYLPTAKRAPDPEGQPAPKRPTWEPDSFKLLVLVENAK